MVYLGLELVEVVKSGEGEVEIGLHRVCGIAAE
jgi:hypothetical protein